MRKKRSLATSESLHRLNRLVGSPRAKFAAALFADLAGLRYTIVRVDPVSACNLRCGMCFFSSAAWRAEHAKGHLSKEELERIAASLFPQALQVHFGASMEPTTFKDYPWLVELAKRHRVPFVGFTTNGQMLTPDGLRRLIAAGLDEITVSTHGVLKETYEELMRRASFEKHHKMLAELTGMRAAAGAPRLRINYTANPDNLAELAGFFDVYGDYALTTLQVRPVYDFALGDMGYGRNSLAEFTRLYDEVMQTIIAECTKRRIHLLANTANPTHEGGNVSAHVYKTAFLRTANPEFVWREDFEWRRETAAEYRRRTSFRRALAREIIRPTPAAALAPSQAAAFDVY